MILQLANNERLQYAISDVGFCLLSHVLFFPFFLFFLEGSWNVLEVHLIRGVLESIGSTRTNGYSLIIPLNRLASVLRQELSL